MLSRMVLYLNEIEQYLKRSQEKFEIGKITIEKGYYADSISDFYYSMVFMAVALLSVKGVKTKTHGGLIGQFGEEFVLTGEFSRDIVKYFSQVETLRNTVDYAAFNGVTKKMALNKMKQTEKFLQEAKRVLKEYYNYD